MIWYLTAALTGAVLGVFFGFAWRRIVSAGGSRKFYKCIGTVFRTMLSDLDADFVSLYKTLIGESFRYVGVQFLGLLIALSPIILLSVTLGPTFHAWNNSRADSLTVHPQGAAEYLLVVGLPAQTLKDGGARISAPASSGTGHLHLQGGNVPLAEPSLNQAVCADGSIGGVLLSALGFHVAYVDRGMFGDAAGPVIVRPWTGDINPFWPYLGDLETILFASMGLFSVPAMFLFRRRQGNRNEAQEDGLPKISLIDDLLTSLTSSGAGFFRWLGDKESGYFKLELSKVAIDRPIFVSGLARSGTTVVLEMLASLPAVATHQYRDFPFVMTPMFWHGFTSRFSSRDTPMERPHKDGIVITRQSPEAFEEPIWQHFFPHVHDSQANHTIEEQNGSEEFGRFFSGHIRKILLLRKGHRYLSKGNYNLTRIRYLVGLFPDACFVVPVRHPLEHVWSLVRQDELFRKYAEADERIAGYMASAGHYEFGPQRVPINVRSGTGQRVLDAWNSGRDHVGYAIMWAEVYRYISGLIERKDPVAERLLVLRYEDLCAQPAEVLKSVVAFCGLDGREGVSEAAGRVRKGRTWSTSMTEDVRLEIWHEVSDVAERFGYRLEDSPANDVDSRSCAC